MATKSKTARTAKPKVEKFPRKAARFQSLATDSEAEQARQYAVTAISSELAASRVIISADQQTGIGQGVDVPSLMDHLRTQGAAVNRGDMSQAEAMLMNQATALQSLFTRLAERGMGGTGLAQFEADMRLALRAQAQCRATLETLSTIKNPPVIFAKQANVTTGPQQINNGVAASRTQENEIEPSKLLEAQDGNYLDTGTTGATIGCNQEMETVGAIDRAEVRGRQSGGIT